MQVPVSRLPWAREFCLVFRIFGCHPIVWQEDRFVVSGLGFMLLNYFLSAVFISNAISRCVWSNVIGQNNLPAEFRKNPIAKELDAFMLMLYMAFQLVTGSFIVCLTLQRRKIASVFNLLNALWSR